MRKDLLEVKPEITVYGLLQACWLHYTKHGGFCDRTKCEGAERATQILCNLTKMYQLSMIHITTVQQALKICTAEKFRNAFKQGLVVAWRLYLYGTPE
jgi:hypothetical protein